MSGILINVDSEKNGIRISTYRYLLSISFISFATKDQNKRINVGKVDNFSCVVKADNYSFITVARAKSDDGYIMFALLVMLASTLISPNILIFNHLYQKHSTKAEFPVVCGSTIARDFLWKRI